MAIPDGMRNVLPVNICISQQDFRKGRWGWKETTSTSPSGRHLGHYKVALTDTEITRGYQLTLNIPIKHGFVARIWQNAVSVLFEKDPGSPKLSRLRIIHLFEADYNMFLKLIWGCRLVGHAEDHGQLGDDMQGSRKHRGTMDLLSKKLLSYDISRQYRLNMAIFDNDNGMRMTIGNAYVSSHGTLRNIKANKVYSENNIWNLR